MPPYKIKTIAELTGFAPELLRAWERRYGLLAPVRTQTGHRLYTAQDLAVLREVRRQLDNGRSIGEVAANGRAGLLRESPSGLGELRSRALACALQLDAAGLDSMLDEAFAQLGPDRVIEGLIIPTAREVGEMWAAGRATVASEHLQSAVYARRLDALRSPQLASEPVYLVSCLEGERHELASRLVAYYLARAGLCPLYMASDLPLSELEGICAARRPAAVLLSVTREAVLVAQLDRLVELAPRLGTPLVLGGAGVVRHAPRLEAAGVRCWEPGTSLRALAESLR